MTPRGEVVRLNRWLAELLRRMPRGRYLEEALGSFARTIADTRPPRTGARHVEPPSMRELRTAMGTCRMWGWWVELDRYGLGRLVLMTVQPVDLEAVPDEVLRKRFGLTRRQIAVARLLAEGRSNEGIAVALCISQYTARHHTEAVMAKLGVSSRAEVGPRLRNLPPENSN
jgi:DNA-binding CsgD family transcriptional regulator